MDHPCQNTNNISQFLSVLQVQDTPQGCYSRVLENSDKIEELKARWLNEKDFYFCICRKQFIPRCGSLTTESPVEGIIINKTYTTYDYT